MQPMSFDEKGRIELKKQLESIKETEIYPEFFTKFSELIMFRKQTLEIKRKSVYLIFDLLCRKKGEITVAVLIVAGLNSRIFVIFEGIIDEMIKNRATNATILLRAQIENIALAYKIVKDNLYLKKLFNGERTNILTLIDSVSKKYNGLREDYDSYCEFAHPNNAALFQNFQPNEDNHFTFSSNGIGFKNKDDEIRFFRSLIIWTKWAQDELEIATKSIK